MRIALINENSQVSKNEIIFNTLKKVCDKKNYEVYNMGMKNGDDKNLTYVQNGLLAAILLNSKTVDFVVTGCGTGEGAMLALNSFPNVNCGLIIDSTDAFLFSQINAGNAVSIPYAKGFGWGSELTLENIFENLFKQEAGGGYPAERREPEMKNKKILDDVKSKTFRNIEDIIKDLDKDFVKETIDRKEFISVFEKNAQDNNFKKLILDILK